MNKFQKELKATIIAWDTAYILLQAKIKKGLPYSIEKEACKELEQKLELLIARCVDKNTLNET